MLETRHMDGWDQNDAVKETEYFYPYGEVNFQNSFSCSNTNTMTAENDAWQLFSTLSGIRINKNQ